jgi:hypothetical protein
MAISVNPKGHTVRQGPDSESRPQVVLMLSFDRQQWENQQRLQSPMIRRTLLPIAN